jgi:hypothetical protein
VESPQGGGSDKISWALGRGDIREAFDAVGDNSSRGVDRVGWRVLAWGAACGIKRTAVYELLKRGAIQGRKSGKITIITTSLAEYLASLPSYRPKS